MARAAQAAKAEKPKTIELELPRMRLINNALWVKDAYVDEKGNEGTPRYRIEAAAAENDPEFGKIIDTVADYCIEEYGENIYLFDVDDPVKGAEAVISPFHIGDKLARDREARGKVGDAYKGMFVIRADTAYNWQGQDAPGGVGVYDDGSTGEVKRISPMQQDQVYNGCYIIPIVTLSFYKTNRGEPACKFYLKAVQKVDDGEPLTAAPDYSKTFKPVGRAAAAEGGRRSRRG